MSKEDRRRRSAGAKPPEGAEWQIGKTVSSITFVKHAEVVSHTFICRVKSFELGIDFLNKTDLEVGQLVWFTRDLHVYLNYFNRVIVVLSEVIEQVKNGELVLVEETNPIDYVNKRVRV